MALRQETDLSRRGFGEAEQFFPLGVGCSRGPRPAVDNGGRGELLAEFHPADPGLRDAERGGHVLTRQPGALAETAKRGAKFLAPRGQFAEWMHCGDQPVSARVMNSRSGTAWARATSR